MGGALEPPLVYLAVTHVYYSPHDPFSLVSAYLALIPQALMVIYVTLIYARREIEVVLMFAGQLLCELANWILKRLIKEDRPKGTYFPRSWSSWVDEVEILGEGYGMPSSHSQFMAFFAVYVALYLLHRYPSPPSNNYSLLYRTRKTALVIRLLQSTIVLCGASLVCMSRIYLRYHTPRQVIAGAGTGAFLGIAWYISVIVLRSTGIVDWVLRWRVVEMLWFKDGDIGSLEHDLYEEWMEWRAQRNKERATKVKKG